MSTAQSDLANLFECTELAAGEMCKTALDLSGFFVAIYDCYDLDFLLAAKRGTTKAFFAPLRKKLSKALTAKQSEQLEKDNIKRNYKALSLSSRRLIDAFKTALEAKEKFKLAVNTANAQNYLGQTQMLSETLNALHTHNQLREPLKVSEGRIAYEAIERDVGLLTQVGALPEVYG